MAELNSDDSPNSSRTTKLLWNASHLLTLGLVNRFFRNYKRYYETSWNYADREQLLSTCYDLEHKIYAYEGLQVSSTKQSTNSGEHQIPTLLLRQQIHELYEYLHHQLLYRNPDTIDEIIPLVDQQLVLWDQEETSRNLSDRELMFATRNLSHIEILIQDKLDR